MKSRSDTSICAFSLRLFAEGAETYVSSAPPATTFTHQDRDGINEAQGEGRGGLEEARAEEARDNCAVEHCNGRCGEEGTLRRGERGIEAPRDGWASGGSR